MPFQQIDVGPRNPLREQPRLSLAPITPLREPPDQKSVRSVVDEDFGRGRRVGSSQQSCPVIRWNGLRLVAQILRNVGY